MAARALACCVRRLLRSPRLTGCLLLTHFKRMQTLQGKADAKKAKVYGKIGKKIIQM